MNVLDQQQVLIELGSHKRYPYQARKSPSFSHWPEEKTLAVYFAMNLEHFSFDSPEGAKLIPQSHQPDVLNYSWRDYGNRVGAWYLADLFRETNIPPAVIANTSILDYCPELLDNWLALPGSELIAHGHTNSQRQGELMSDQEAELIRYCYRRLTEYQAKPVNGWLSPWISESMDTPEHLRANNFLYTLNWAHDDTPGLFRTEKGSLLSIPYPQEINDIPTIIPNGASMPVFCQMIEDQFTELLRRSGSQPQVMGIALHPYIVGQPFRMHRLRETLFRLMEQQDKFWLTTPGQIADHFLQHDI